MDAMVKEMIKDEQTLAVLTLCQRAGEAILSVYEQAGDLEIQQKSDDSPLTRADLAAHSVLHDGLVALTPDLPVLSEEGDVPSWEQRQAWSEYWIIDPLDGTKEFINRNGEFTVNVARIVDGEAVMGVVHVPVLGVSYIGIKGLGAWKIEADNCQLIQSRSLPDSKDEPVYVVASRRHGSDAVQDMMEKIVERFGGAETRSMGSSLKLCLVAEGAADLYPRLALTCEWDTAAAQAVVEAAGGQVFDADWQVLRYNGKDSLLNPFFYVVGDQSFDWQALLS